MLKVFNSLKKIKKGFGERKLLTNSYCDMLQSSLIFVFIDSIKPLLRCPKAKILPGNGIDRMVLILWQREFLNSLHKLTAIT